MSRLSRIPPWVLAAVLAGIYLIVNPPSADLAAQTYRTTLFEHAGFVVWDNGWYSGHHNPAYSILFPPLAAWTSPQFVGAVAAVVSAWAFERIVAGMPGGRAASYWFATATLVSLLTGRLTFALGLAFAVLAVLALARDRLALSALLGALSALASPVAAAFLALALVAWWWSSRRTVATALLLAAALVPAVALSVLFPEGGSFPFTIWAFLPTLAGTLLVIAVLWRDAPTTLRAGLVLYALLLLVSDALATPMGGNAVRLGAILAGPLAALTLWPDRRRALALLVLPLVYWQVSAPFDDVHRASDDASVHAAYYDGLLAFFHEQQHAQGPFRIEIPFTDNHWESARVAPTVPLARGWERQLDRKLNPLFYGSEAAKLTPATYRAWLDENAVRYVALADAPIDYSSAHEAALVRNGAAPYLREVWHDAHWRVFSVADATPLADAGARVTGIDADRVDLTARRATTVHLRVHWSPYWHITRGAGCVVKDGDWTALRLTRPGAVRISAGFAIGRIGATSPRCTPAGA
ncbi:MAG TPA: hypothetical protein VI318_03300 [Baekduia sp.]